MTLIRDGTLFNVHCLEIFVHGLLLVQDHGIERNLLSSWIIVTSSTVPLMREIAFQWVLREHFTQQVVHMRNFYKLWPQLSKGLDCI